MIYYNINKLQVINGVLTKTPIGYVTSQDDANYIDLTHNGNEYLTWIEDNKPGLIAGDLVVEDFFTVSNPIAYTFDSTSNYPITDNEITNLNNPEG